MKDQEPAVIQPRTWGGVMASVTSETFLASMLLAAKVLRAMPTQPPEERVKNPS